MKRLITIECPEISCRRCGVTAVLDPTVVRHEAFDRHVFVGNAAAAPTSEFSAGDDCGGKWQVLAVQPPADWSQSDKGYLCPRCQAARHELDAAFMEGSLPPALELPLNARLPAPPPSAEETVMHEPPRTIYPEQKTTVSRQALPESTQPRQVVANAQQHGVPQNARVTPLSVPPQRFQPAVSSMPTVVRPNTVTPTPMRPNHEAVTQAPVMAHQPTVSPIPTAASAPPESVGHIPRMAEKPTVTSIPIRGEVLASHAVQPNTKDTKGGPDHSEPPPILDTARSDDVEDILPAS